jgi:hypothetical protein
MNLYQFCIDTARRILPKKVLAGIRSILVRNLKGDPKAVFTEIHRRNIWGYRESVSGGGSTLLYTQKLRTTLPRLIAELKADSILDLPCGDLNWMSQIDLPVSRYIGGDIVEQVVVDAQNNSGRPGREFRVLDLCKDPLPKTDVLLCRHCLMHLSEDMVFLALSNILRSDIRYLVTSTFPKSKNRSIRTGDFFPINLCSEPYSLPAPSHALEDWTPPFDEHYLGVWDIAALRKFALAGGSPRLVSAIAGPPTQRETSSR